MTTDAPPPAGDTAPESETPGTSRSRREPTTFAGRLWHNWIKPIGIAALLVFGFRSTFADWNDVPSSSMEPTILVGDRVFVNKLAYDLKFPFTKWRLVSWGTPERGEIVIWFRPDDGTRMVKRIIGLPGDRVEVHNDQLFINDEPIAVEIAPDVDFIDVPITDPGAFVYKYEQLRDGRRHAVMLTPNAPPDRREYRMNGVVPEGHYFVMGDNRHRSNDSRYFDTFTFVPMHEIVGRVQGIAFSIDRPRSYAPRWQRFFRGVD